MIISLLAAVAQNGVIGRDGDLPWRLPADLRRFKALTMGHHVVMGRRTYDSIGRVLPGRTFLVLSRDPQLEIAGAVVFGSLDAAVEHARAAGESELFVIGGAAVYDEALPRADRLHLTRVEAAVPGDTHFPEFDAARWSESEREAHPADDRHPHAYTFYTLDRVVPD